MKALALLIAAAVAVVAVAPIQPVVAAPKKPYVLKGKSYAPVRRAYKNLRKSDTYESRKFYDWSMGARTQGEPFDNGFFFETPTGPFGAYTPYFN